MPHAPKCPECGLPSDAEEAPRSSRWATRFTIAKIACLVLALAYITSSSTRSNTNRYVASSGGALRALPGTRPTIDPAFGYLTVGDLRWIARAETPHALDVDALLRMPAGYAGSDHLETDQFAVQLSSPLAGSTNRGLAFGWPLPMAWISTYTHYTDIATGVVAPAARLNPTTTFNWDAIRRSWVTAAGSDRSIGISPLNAMVALGAAALLTAAAKWWRRRSGRYSAVRGFLRPLVAVILFVGLLLPMPSSRTQSLPANASVFRIQLTRGEAMAFADAPDAASRIARAVLDAIDGEPLTADERHRFRAGRTEQSAPPSDEQIRSIVRSDAHAVLYVPGMPWPNASVARASTTPFGSPVQLGEFTEVTSDVAAINWPEPGSSRLVRTKENKFGWEHRDARELRITRLLIDPRQTAVLVAGLFAPLTIATLLEAAMLNRSRRRLRQRGLCISCGYDLTGVPLPPQRLLPGHITPATTAAR